MAPWLGSVLTLLFTGFGQGLAGRWWRMAAWLVALLGAGFLVNVSPWFLYALLAIKLACAADAYLVLSADRGTVKSNRAAFVSIVVCLAGAWYLRMVEHAFYVPSSSMVPTVEIGDDVFVDTLGPARGLHRGEVVALQYPCDPAIDYIKRIVALGGDTVEMRCGVLYVNGKAVPREAVPGTCEYAERDDHGRWSSRYCAAYRETLGDAHYEVLHDPDELSLMPDVHDFPRMNGLVPRCQQAGGDVKSPGEIVGQQNPSHPCAPQLHYVVPAGQVFVLGDNRDNSNDSRYWGGVAESAIIGRVTGIWLSHGEHGYSLGRVGRVH